MKKMRKIIPALAMLLVSAVMMSTASFAWFSMNNRATVTGMQVKATSTGGLAIATYTTGENNAATAPLAENFKTSVAFDWSNQGFASTATNKVASLVPTSTDGTTWYTASAATVDNYAKDTNAYVPVTLTGNTAGSNIFLKTMFQVKSLNEDATDTVKVSVGSITVTNPGTATVNVNLAKALRVAIYADGDWYFFAPNQTAPGDGVAPHNYVKTGGTVVAYNGSEEALVYGATPNTQIISSVNNTPATIEVYIYFEGEDPNCMSANAVSLQNLSVVIEFTCADNT